MLCFPSQVTKFPWQQDEVAALWRAAKEDYIDKGSSWEDTVNGLSRDFGVNIEHVVQAMTMPKVIRHISNDVWRTQERRREILQQARETVEGFEQSGLGKRIDQLYQGPRSALTIGHGAVFPNSHMGSFIFNPTRWDTMLRAERDAWRFMKEKPYQIAIMRHLADPYYDFARRASRSVDPGDPTVGIISNMKGWTGRGFNALKIARLDLFKKEFKANITPQERAAIEGGHQMSPDMEKELLDLAKPIMNRIDAATGEFSLGKAGKPLSYLLFAPKLVPARFKTAIDVPRALWTAANWAKANRGERAAAKFVLKNAAATLTTYAASLALNDGILASSDSEDRINWKNPAQSDWLSFKIGGFSIRPPNALIETLRLAGGMIYPYFASEKQLKGQSPEQAAGANVADYARYKLHPTIRLGSELLAGRDLFNRPLPTVPESVPEPFGGHQLGVRPLVVGDKTPSEARPQLSWGEYMSGKGPIFLGGMAREFYQQLRDQGMDHGDAKTWMRSLGVMLSELEGVPAHSIPPDRSSRL